MPIQTDAIRGHRRESVAVLLLDLIHRKTDWSRACATRTIDRLALWHDRVRQRRALAQLDDRLLHDIGLTRDDALRESAKPFWR